MLDLDRDPESWNLIHENLLHFPASSQTSALSFLVAPAQLHV